MSAFPAGFWLLKARFGSDPETCKGNGSYKKEGTETREMVLLVSFTSHCAAGIPSAALCPIITALFNLWMLCCCVFASSKIFTYLNKVLLSGRALEVASLFPSAAWCKAQHSTAMHPWDTAAVPAGCGQAGLHCWLLLAVLCLLLVQLLSWQAGSSSDTLLYPSALHYWLNILHSP